MSDTTPLNMTLAQAQQWIPDSRLVGDPATVIARVHTDTRTLAPGDLFVALKGERFDANDFLAQAREHGAVAAIAHHGLEAAGLAGLEVPDSLAALGALGAGWRAQFELPLIAVTGSNGKTTVTQMIAACCSRSAPNARWPRPATSTTRSACRSRCCACAGATSAPCSSWA
jgi:UDP-N-acetylmuramoyl-tripeptide--D-alanyl-D-alanine ligase